MRKYLLALCMATAALSATTFGANIQFEQGGGGALADLDVPLGTGPVSLELRVDLLDGEKMGGGVVDFTATDAALIPFSNVVFQGAWGGFSAYDGNVLFSLFQMSTADGPLRELVATFEVLTGALAAGDYLLDPTGPQTSLVDGANVPLSVLTATPLTIHVLPEPATIGLLILGGMVVLGRRFGP
jgi:hypothetical protein